MRFSVFCADRAGAYMKMKCFLIILSFLINTFALAGAPTSNSEQSAIRRARLQQNSAIFRHDVEEIASYWTDDVTICRGLGLQLAGKAAYRKLFEGDDPTSKD